jgi:hypothetical protein
VHQSIAPDSAYRRAFCKNRQKSRQHATPVNAVLYGIRKLVMEKEIYGIIGILLGGLLKALFDFIRVRLDHDHAEKMHKLENQGKENIKELLLDMLNHRTHIDRTFDALKKRIGGYSDDEVRKLLMELGACRT